MLTQRIEFPADPRFDGVIEHLQPHRVLQACREQLTSAPASERDSWRCCRLVESMYHPGRHLRLAYAMLEDETIPKQRNWPQGQIVYLHAPARQPMSQRGRILKLGCHEVEAYLFPNDRRLRRLRKFQARDDASTAWQDWIGASSDDFRIDATTLRRVLIRYVPEQKWIIRLRARGLDPANGRESKRSIAVRCASRRSCSELLSRHHSLSNASRTTTTPYDVPRIIGADPAGGIVATEWLRGKSLLDTLGSEAPREVMQRVADVMCSFHTGRTDGLKSLGVAEVRQRVQEAAGDLSYACPELAAQISHIASIVRETIQTIEPGISVRLHNDFHWDQFRIDEGRFVLLDFERMCLGNPLVDVANFATQLRMLGHRPQYGVNQSTAASWAVTFLEEWQRRSGQPIDPLRCRCFTILSLLELARGMMRHLRSGWRDLVDACIRQARAEASHVRTEAFVA